MTDTWESWRAQIADDPRGEWCNELLLRLPQGARLIDLGCGGGAPETKLLADRFRVTGVDLSEEQVRRARVRIPNAHFIHADFTAIDFEPDSIDAVAAFYSFNHVPRDLLAPLYARIRTWLAPQGLFMTALGTSDTENWTGDFLGARNYFSSFPPELNTSMLDDAGFELLRNELVTISEPEGDATFQWILARR